MIHIDRLELHGFKQFAEKKEFRFSDGINVITGPNEAGKSTILDGILTALFSLKPSEIESFLSWDNGDSCTVELEFNIDNDTYKIKRDLREDRSGLWKKDTKGFTEISRDKKKIDKFVDKHFGFKEWRVFTNTLVIGQNDITILQPKTQPERTTFNKLKQMIEKATSGSKDVDSPLSKIIENINTMHSNLVSTQKRNAKIPHIEKKIADIKNQLDSARNDERNLARNSADKENIEKELIGKEAKLKTLELRKELYDSKERLSKKKFELEEENQQIQSALERVKILQDDRTHIEERAGSLEIKYKNITDDIERKIHSLTTSCKEKQKRITEKGHELEKVHHTTDIQNEKKDLYPGFDSLSEDDIHSISINIEMWKKTCTRLDEQPNNNRPNSKNRYLIVAALVVAGVLGGMILGNIVAGVIAGILLGVVAYYLFSTKGSDDVRKQSLKEKEMYEIEFSQIKEKIPVFDPLTFRDISKKYVEIVRSIKGFDSKIEDLNTDIEKETELLTSQNNELNEITGSLPGFSYEDFKVEFPQLKKTRSDIQAKKEALENLLAGSSEDEMKQTRRNNASELLKLDGEWDEKNLDYINFSDEEINEIAQIESIRRDVNEKKEVRAELSGRVNESANVGRNVIGLEETLESLQEQYNKLVYKASVVETLKKYMSETDDEIKARFAPQVAEKMAPWLSSVTNGKYSSMSLNADLELAVKVPETDTFVDVDKLSRGTQDQVYLGIRLVIGDLISGERNVPVFLDDTMHTFDAMRLASAKTVFDKVAQERQVFIFSHNEAYKRWGENGAVIEL